MFRTTSSRQGFRTLVVGPLTAGALGACLLTSAPAAGAVKMSSAAATVASVDASAAAVKKPVRDRNMTENGIKFLKRFEGGPRLRPYNDSEQNCTVGWGHLLHKGTCTAKERASRYSLRYVQKLLARDIRVAESALDRAIGSTPVTVAQFDALVSFVFNIGEGNFIGAGAKQPSNVYLDLRARPIRYTAVPAHLRNFGSWQWETSPGLRTRRAAEARLFDTGRYDTPA